ncbi:hypothetical protein BSK66_26660 [Paenibacillus odorifer]|uniref:hypothetical protein n=1 Tax=Paenibacillus TaxID=44249 RepID=UPI0003E2C633|nr:MULTISPECIES: hypothetical protein [Paenibacillus]ETT49330.1 hypothetical protein C171_23695 [Paenibacillus sp. FSL H8-237]OME49542.1 hypothetical protein BSK66_26660 [Paenibacillus odorifer]
MENGPLLASFIFNREIEKAKEDELRLAFLRKVVKTEEALQENSKRLGLDTYFILVSQALERYTPQKGN